MMNYSISLKSIFVLAAILLLASATGWAQDSRISGTVTDSTGGIIPGVEVTVTNLDTGVSRQVVTDDSGHFSVPQLFGGNYRVGASMAGFDAQQLELLNVMVKDRRSVRGQQVDMTSHDGRPSIVIAWHDAPAISATMRVRTGA